MTWCGYRVVQDVPTGSGIRAILSRYNDMACRVENRAFALEEYTCNGGLC